MDENLLALLRGLWPNQWQAAEQELLWTRLSASPKFRAAVQHETGLRASAEAVLQPLGRQWPDEAEKSRRRQLQTATILLGVLLCGLGIRAALLHRAATPADGTPLVMQTPVAKTVAGEVITTKEAAPKQAAAAKFEAAKETPTPAINAKDTAQQNKATKSPAASPEKLKSPAANQAASKSPTAVPVRIQPPVEVQPAAEEPVPQTAHPLLLETTREAQTFALELKVALAEEAWLDVHRVWQSLTPESDVGLMQDEADDALWVSYTTLVDSLIMLRPALRDWLRTEFEPLAKLRLAAATEQDDAGNVATVAWHFHGTLAAAEAQAWLADRALTTGNFPLARLHYERALAQAPASRRGSLENRLRLTGAMLGTPLGKPPAGPVHFEARQMSPLDFEALILTQQLTHRRRQVSSGQVGAEPALLAIPSPTPAAALKFSKWVDYEDVTFVRQREKAPDSRDVPLPELFAQSLGETTLLGNALFIASVDSGTGKQRWRRELTSVKERHGIQALGSVTPAVADGQIYVRRWKREGTELLCLQANSGDVLWQMELTPEERNRTFKGLLLTDPQIAGDRMQLITATTDQTVQTRSRPRTEDLIWKIELTEISRRNGAILRQSPLVTLTGLTHVPRASQLATLGRRRVVQIAGTAICLEASGDLAWVRKQEWHEPDIADSHHRSAAAGNAQTVCIWQPGGATVEGLDLATGRRRWTAPASQFVRLVGAVQGRLLAVTNDGLEAIDLTNGRTVWSRPLTWSAAQSVICGEGKLLYADVEETPTGNFQSRLCWVDAVSGETITTKPLTGDLPEARAPHRPVLAPLIPWGSGLLAGYDPLGPRKARRDLLWVQPDEGMINAQ